MPRILVIDDQPQLRASISLTLEAHGITAVTAASGRLGLSEVDASELAMTPFDAALVDIYMPEMDGLQLIRALRERKPDLPIIAMSGVLLPATGTSVLDRLPPGIRRLQKPFRSAQLLQAVQLAWAWHNPA
jgi:CheY-like chemotaxis protein